MDRLELVIAVSDVLLGIKKAQTTEIQNEVKFCNGNNLADRYLAVACIAGHYGNNTDRKKALGRYADKVQARINAIYAMRGKTVTQTAKDVINGNYDKESVQNCYSNSADMTPKRYRIKSTNSYSPRNRLHVSASMWSISVGKMNPHTEPARLSCNMLQTIPWLSAYSSTRQCTRLRMW